MLYLPSILVLTSAILVTALGATNAQAQSEEKQRPLAERITEAAVAGRQLLEFNGERFSGPAWQTLVAEGKAAQFFLLGEEHGIAENPKLAGALFSALAPAGYSRFMIEVSPPMARSLDAAARNGVDGLRNFYATPGSEPAFYGRVRRILGAVRGDAQSAIHLQFLRRPVTGARAARCLAGA